MNSKKISRLMLIIGVAFIALIVNITRIDVTEHEKYADKTATERDNIIRRGSIIDRNGVILAKSTGKIENQKREYPYKNLYAHIVGYRNTDGGHIAGIEEAYHLNLTGQDDTELLGGAKTFLNDLELAFSEEKERKGSDIILTIDHNLQEAAQKALKDKGYAGSIVVMNPKTGEILAMVSSPDFDPTPETLSEEIQRTSAENMSAQVNRAVQSLYSPGSTFKIIDTAALYTNGMHDFKLNEKFERKTDMREYNGSSEIKYKNLESAFKHSSNIYFAEAIAELGGDKLKETSRNFMLGKDIELDILKNTKNKVSVATLPGKDEVGYKADGLFAIGQGKVGITPLQLAMIASAIANDGTMMQPYMIQEITEPTSYTARPEELKQCVSTYVAGKIKDLMRSVVNESGGTGEKAFKDFIEGIEVCGKTGTADTATKGKVHTLFLGFAPYDDPEIAISVVLENLPSGKTGGSEAAPIARIVLEKYFELN